MDEQLMKEFHEAVQEVNRLMVVAEILLLDTDRLLERNRTAQEAA